MREEKNEDSERVMTGTKSDPPQNSSLITQHSTLRALGVLVVQSFQRQWRVRQMGYVSLGLLSLVVAWVALMTNSPAGWGIAESRVGRGGTTYRVYAERMLLPPLIGVDGTSAFNTAELAVRVLVRSIPYTIVSLPEFQHAFAYMKFSRIVVIGAFVGFVLPLFTLSYATAAFGTDRESRSLVWLMTRPIPRSGIYLAKFVGALPWCLGFGLGGFAALCLAGGENGRQALAMYWPAAAAGTVAFSALFHLIGAIFRRPVVVGLVYVFFFEALVAALPGSLKLLSLSFYVRSLMYNEAVAAGYPTDMLELSQAVSPTTAWAVLAIAAAGLTGLGMWLFSRSEYRDDV